MITNSQANSMVRVKVFGVGGAGINAINRMIETGIPGVDFVAIDTDANTLLLSKAEKHIQIGKNITRGLGAGGNSEIGRKAAEDSSIELNELLQDTDMVFITAGMGGGTGTGAAPFIAEVAKECDTLAIGIVTRPFTFEGMRRLQTGELGIKKMKEYAHTLIAIPNDRILQIADKRASLQDAFRLADDVLRQAVQSIAELATNIGMIHLSFADVRTIMSEGGAAFIALGRGTGSERARKAAEDAITSKLLDITIDGARGVLFNVTGGSDMTLFEVNQVAAIIREVSHPDVNLIFGAVIDPILKDEIRITLIATGFDQISTLPNSIDSTYQHVPVVQSVSTSNMQLKETTLHIDDALTPALLETSIAPYIEALSSLQHLIDELQGHPLSKVRINSITSVASGSKAVEVDVISAKNVIESVEIGSPKRGI